MACERFYNMARTWRLLHAVVLEGQTFLRLRRSLNAVRLTDSFLTFGEWKKNSWFTYVFSAVLQRLAIGCKAFFDNLTAKEFYAWFYAELRPWNKSIYPTDTNSSSHRSLTFLWWLHSMNTVIRYMYEYKCVAHTKNMNSAGGGGGYSTYPWMGRCGTAAQTLTLFKTKIVHFVTRRVFRGHPICSSILRSCSTHSSTRLPWEKDELKERLKWRASVVICVSFCLSIGRDGLKKAVHLRYAYIFSPSA